MSEFGVSPVVIAAVRDETFELEVLLDELDAQIKDIEEAWANIYRLYDRREEVAERIDALSVFLP